MIGMADPNSSFISLNKHLDTPNAKTMIIGILFTGHELAILENKPTIKIIFNNNTIHSPGLSDINRDNLLFFLIIMFHALNGIIYRIREYCIQIYH